MMYPKVDEVGLKIRKAIEAIEQEYGIHIDRVSRDLPPGLRERANDGVGWDWDLSYYAEGGIATITSFIYPEEGQS